MYLTLCMLLQSQLPFVDRSFPEWDKDSAQPENPLQTLQSLPGICLTPGHCALTCALLELSAACLLFLSRL